MEKIVFLQAGNIKITTGSFGIEGLSSSIGGTAGGGSQAGPPQAGGGLQGQAPKPTVPVKDEGGGAANPSAGGDPHAAAAYLLSLVRKT